MLELIIAVILSSIPIMLAATGELVVERSGVLNLGVEGMMLMGAVIASITVITTGSLFLAVIFGALSGLLTSIVFGFFALVLATNQVATGLALTIFGTGLSGLIGAEYVGKAIQRLEALNIPILSNIPYLGPILFSHNILVYFSFIMAFIVGWFLLKTRPGLVLRAVGNNHDSAHALGYSVVFIRFCSVMFGGLMAGLGGAFLPLVLTPHWAEGMTAGKGWIALALVVFASWRPLRIPIGALLFSGITVMQLVGQARGWAMPSQFLSMLPYLATIAVLVIISRNKEFSIINAPASLGKLFIAGK
ncbi:MAG: ABC transporter permease [Alphaproteobacteria bacterium]|nr:MAG: ABC transporter permease [Alphaproteobacteria bacterium]